MKKYSLMHPLVYSFFSRSLYRDVGSSWKGHCLLYLLCLLSLSVIPGVLRARLEIVADVSAAAPGYIRQLPTITIHKGALSIDRPEPYLIVEESTGRTKAVIDTTGKISSLEGSEAVVLVTKTSLVVKKDAKETKTFDLTAFDGVSLDSKSAYDLLEIFEEFIPVVLYPVAVFFSFLRYALEIFLLALIGVLLCRAAKTPLSAPALIRVSAISITPGTVLGALLVLSGLKVPYWPMISFASSLFYLFFGIRANAGSDTPQAT